MAPGGEGGDDRHHLPVDDYRRTHDEHDVVVRMGPDIAAGGGGTIVVQRPPPTDPTQHSPPSAIGRSGHHPREEGDGGGGGGSGFPPHVGHNASNRQLTAVPILPPPSHHPGYDHELQRHALHVDANQRVIPPPHLPTAMITRAPSTTATSSCTCQKSRCLKLYCQVRAR